MVGILQGYKAHFIAYSMLKRTLKMALTTVITKGPLLQLSRLLLSFQYRHFIRFVATFAIVYVVFVVAYNRRNSSGTWIVRGCCCSWNETILLNLSGRYNMKLCYKGVLPRKLRPPPMTITESAIKVNGKNNSLTFEQLANISDREWKWSFDESVYNLYPLSTPINETLNRVLSDSLLIEVKTTFES